MALGFPKLYSFSLVSFLSGIEPIDSLIYFFPAVACGCFTCRLSKSQQMLTVHEINKSAYYQPNMLHCLILPLPRNLRVNTVRDLALCYELMIKSSLQLRMNLGTGFPKALPTNPSKSFPHGFITVKPRISNAASRR
jgi:hypothetical protein